VGVVNKLSWFARAIKRFLVFVDRLSWFGKILGYGKNVHKHVIAISELIQSFRVFPILEKVLKFGRSLTDHSTAVKFGQHQSLWLNCDWVVTTLDYATRRDSYHGNIFVQVAVLADW